jgi:hypothetical protein
LASWGVVQSLPRVAWDQRSSRARLRFCSGVWAHHGWFSIRPNMAPLFSYMQDWWHMHIEGLEMLQHKLFCELIMCILWNVWKEKNHLIFNTPPFTLYMFHILWRGTLIKRG